MSKLPPMVEKLLSAAGSPDDDWADFVREYSALLLHVARRTSASRDDAMDAYAYLLERLSEDGHRRLRSYAVDPNSKFTTWLVVVARRMCIDYHRNKYGRIRDRGSTDERDRISRRRRLEHLDDQFTESEEIEDDSAHPDREVEVAELSAELTAALSMLPAADQLLIRLRYEDGHSAAEIARALQYPSQFHVYRRINSILAALQTSLRQRGIESAVS